MKTRSGRLIKPPERYSPNEIVTDDYADDEHDEHDPNGENIAESDYEVGSDDDEESDDDEDSESMAEFIVQDEESDEEAGGAEEGEITEDAEGA
jgi:hypothetical protein